MRVRTPAAVPAFLLALACSGAPEAPAGDRIPVAVSVPPQAYFVDRIGGDRVVVEVLIPPGTSPHTFEPAPRQLMAFSRARLWVKVGHPDFPFEKKHLDANLDRDDRLEVVDMTAGVADHSETAHAESDPHVWLSPAAAALTARRIAQALARLDPAHAELFDANLAAFLADVETLDLELRTTFAGIARRGFVVQHPAWGHLAAHYGLEQIAIESGGKEPGPAALVALIERARQEGVRVVFVQQGIADRTARTLAREVGAEVAVVDPLAYDWIENLRGVGAAFRKALEDR
jgi:zinc transport system substrate-binding protein